MKRHMTVLDSTLSGLDNLWKSTQGSRCCANPGLYDCNLFKVAGMVSAMVFFASSAQLFAQTNTAPAAPAPVAATKTDPFSDPLIKQIEARHEKAVAGDTKETAALTTDLQKLVQEQPNNHLLQAYLGSVYTLDSRDAWPGPGKLTYLKNGGKELDAAVAAAPDNPAVRFIRAIDYYELPTFFGKRQTARDDFVILVKQVEGVTPVPYVLNVDTQQAIYYYAGLCYKQLSQVPEAKDVWERGLKLNPTSSLGVKIDAELKNVK
jgi:tetratricopeptide (TPR) repeat protein